MRTAIASRLPDPVRRALIACWNRWLGFRSARVRSVSNIARSNTRQAFEQLFSSPELVSEYLSPERRAFYDAVAARCASFAARAVVDVGCGTGDLLLAAAGRRTDVERIVGVDYAPAAIARLHERLPAAVGIVASVYELELDETFDLVLCTEVLEHLDRPADAVGALRRLCAEGGAIVVTVPDGERDDYEGHVNFWSLEGLRQLLSVAGPVEVSHLDGETLFAVVRPA